MPKIRDRIIPTVPDVPTPTILRGRYVHRIIKQLNTNTLAIRSPRQLDGEGEEAAIREAQLNLDRPTSEDGTTDTTPQSIPIIGLYEISRTSTTVRVENPEDENQYVDVDRPDRIYMTSTDGKLYVLDFNPPA